LNEVRAPIAGGELNQTKPVAIEVQAQRFRINRNALPEAQALWQIILMERDGGLWHWPCAEFPGPDQVARRQTSDTQQLFMEAYADCLPASQIDGKQRCLSCKRVTRDADFW